MADLKNVLICNYCNSVFDSPLILPCSETICERHVEEFKTKDSSNIGKINCFFCNEEHEIPRNGFPKDKSMKKLLDLKMHTIDFGVSNQKAVDRCHDLNEMIGKLENLTYKPEHYINEYFDLIINKIDLCREENQLKIEKWHEISLKEIEKLKGECLTKLKNLEPEKEMIQSSKNDLEL